MKKRLLPITILASLGVAALAGCGGGSGGGGGGGSTVDVTGVTLNKTSLELYPEGSEKLVATVAPADATDKSVTWKSADSRVCTVDAEGLVTAVAVGTAKVTVTTVDGGYKAECNVTVKLNMNSITITNKADFADGMETTDTKAVNVTGDPTINANDLANKGLLTITSSNTAVATTNKLMIFAVGAGTTTITASLFGKTDSFELTVTEKPVVVVNYGTAEAPLTVSNFLTEVAKLELADKAYSKEHFYVKAKLKSAPSGTSGYKFDLKDDAKEIAVSSAQLEDGKTAADYAIGDIVTVRAYARADKTKANGYYLSYNQSGTSGQEAPKIIYWEKGEGGETVPEPAVVEKTLAEFIAGENTDKLAYLVSGKIKSFKSGSTKDKYGNMTLTDDTNDLIIYGSTMTAAALAWNNVDKYVFSNPEDFMTTEATNNLAVGDTVKMKLIRCDYVTETSTKIEGCGVIVDITPGGGEVPDPDYLTIVDTPVVGTKYKLGMKVSNRGDKGDLFAIGTKDGNYGAVSNQYSEGVDAELVAASEGKYNVKLTYADSSVKYLNVKAVNDYTNVFFDETASSEYTYDATAKTLFTYVGGHTTATKDGTFYLGTFKTNLTFSPSLISFIQGDNASKVDAEENGQYPLHFCTKGEAPTLQKVVVSPAESDVDLAGKSEAQVVTLTASASPKCVDLGDVAWSTDKAEKGVTVVAGKVTIPLDFVADDATDDITVTATAGGKSGTAVIHVKKDTSGGDVPVANPVVLQYSDFGLSGTTTVENAEESKTGVKFIISKGSGANGIAKSGTMTNQIAIPGKITKIEIKEAKFSAETKGEATVYVGATSGAQTTSVGVFQTSGDYSYDVTGSYSFITLALNSQRTLKFTSITITYEALA